jgi:HEAT repeat protein
LWVRYYAARSFGEHVDGADIPELAARAEQDPAVPVRIAAIDALGARGLGTATASLLRCAADAEPEVATAALRALGRLRSPEALDSLRGAGRAVEPERRRAAVDGLGAHGSSEAITQLEWIAAADTDASIADRAVGALADIAAAGGPAATDAIDSLLELCAVPDRRHAATAGLGGLPPGTIPRVARGLRHADPTVRRRTVDVLARFRSPEATRELGTAFGDADAGVRETAAVNVMHLGTAAYDDLLIQLRDKDPSKAVRRAAAAVLASRRPAD